MTAGNGKIRLPWPENPALNATFPRPIFPGLCRLTFMLYSEALPAATRRGLGLDPKNACSRKKGGNTTWPQLNVRKKWQFSSIH